MGNARGTGMRRLATALGALAFLWACAATVYLLTTAGYEGISTSSALSGGGGEGQRITASLVAVNGPWVVGLLVGVSLLAGMPLGVALAHPDGQGATTWSAGLLLLGFSIVSGFSVGLFYAPSAMLLVTSAIVTLFIHGGSSPATSDHRGAI